MEKKVFTRDSGIFHQQRKTEKLGLVKHLVNYTIRDPEGALGSVIFWTELIGIPISFVGYFAYKTFSFLMNPTETTPDFYRLCSDILDYLNLM